MAAPTFSFQGVSTALAGKQAAAEALIADAIASLGANPTTADLLTLQGQLSQNKTLMDLIASLNQNIKDLFASVLQKL
jgi:hypothetical protein